MIVGIIQARTGSSRLPGKILMKAAGKTLLEHMIERISNSSIYNNLKTQKEKGIGEIKFNSEIKSFLTEFQWISKVYSKHDLMGDSSLDYEGQLWRNQFHLERSGDLMLVFNEHFVYRYPYGTGHGTPYEYDTHVPLIIMGSEIKNIISPTAYISLLGPVGFTVRTPGSLPKMPKTSS